MKNIILIVSILMLTATVSFAQPSEKTVEVKDIELNVADGYVGVTFTLNAGAKATRSKYVLVAEPAIVKGVDSVVLPSVVIMGKRARHSELRHGLADVGVSREEPLYVQAGNSIRYEATVIYEDWMRSAQLILNGISVGCCSSTETTLGLIVDNILYAEPETEIKIVEVPVLLPPLSTGEVLAHNSSFVSPVSEIEKAMPELFDYNMPFDPANGLSEARQGELARFINDSRKGSISIYFRQGSKEIDPNYATNNKGLIELISVVRAIEDSEDSRIVRIVIAGFASPEGPAGINDRIAWERAVALKNFLLSNSGIDHKLVNLFNGSVDWLRLRELVANSDMYQKYKVIDIIDNEPVRDVRGQCRRHEELLRLDGGDAYRYMESRFFPELRQAAYVKVYFENN